MTGFYEIFLIDNRQAVLLQVFAKIINYSPKYLLDVVKRLRQRKIYIGVKWRKNWYIFLPNPNVNKESKKKQVLTELPSGQKIDVDASWIAARDYQPVALDNNTNKPIVLTINSGGKLGVAVTSSGLIPKTVNALVGVQNQQYRATTEYSYGNYIFYDTNKMSTFDPGTAGTLKSTQVPQAFFEVCRALDAAENTRNGANPGLAPRRNLSTTVSFDTGTIAVAATIPIVTTIQTDGTIQISGSDYLGSTYSTFANGSGDLTSTNIVAAFLETASLLSAAEKAVTPVENQPNNIQIQIDVEAGNATVSGNLPFTTAAAATGDVTVKAIDYL
ncbi:hypothetical protein [Anabaena sp. PCC 7108]|uniref:hypothetical protein n=1 Tax=Anabaena sp. PCC 7108 TaxID=163908 RepID=UPI00036BE32E|nr:hypothetical protein [Anabaena sp. PCC 7108]